MKSILMKSVFSLLFPVAALANWIDCADRAASFRVSGEEPALEVAVDGETRPLEAIEMFASDRSLNPQIFLRGHVGGEGFSLSYGRVSIQSLLKGKVLEDVDGRAKLGGRSFALTCRVALRRTQLSTPQVKLIPLPRLVRIAMASDEYQAKLLEIEEAIQPALRAQGIQARRLQIIAYQAPEVGPDERVNSAEVVLDVGLSTKPHWPGSIVKVATIKVRLRFFPDGIDGFKVHQISQVVEPQFRGD